MKLRCQNCKFTFESERMRDKCPYCGKKNSLAKLESAEELVDIS